MLIVGIDEVGRGCWAGPLVVGAVMLSAAIPGLKDSKLLTRNQRITLDQAIRAKANCWSLGWSEPAEIDELGLTGATKLAIERAISLIKIDYDSLIIDGNINYLKDNLKSSCLIKADNLIPAVSAASIIAKVARDNFMINLAKTYPEYGFDKHVGYGTAAHRQALAAHGPLSIHRRSFSPIKTLTASAGVSTC